VSVAASPAEKAAARPGDAIVARTAGGLLDVLTVTAMAAGLRERLATPPPR
jgi:hypothetical protein